MARYIPQLGRPLSSRRLEDSGLIVQRASRDRRKPYGLTRLGLERATDEVEKLEEIAKVGRKRLRVREAT